MTMTPYHEGLLWLIIGLQGATMLSAVLTNNFATAHQGGIAVSAILLAILGIGMSASKLSPAIKQRYENNTEEGVRGDR